MKSQEEIHIRIMKITWQDLTEMLDLDLTISDSHNGPEALRVYRHAKYETDLCMHLLWDGQLPSQGSTIGQQIAAGVREIGFVKHTVWIETGAR